ncbi:hypothetical protein OUS_1293 [Helicobacter pylori R056a]|uniref:Uncharacterized protein n=1 Tax=Helicobacter pylori R018c TaxID=1145110 RepID=K2KC96_HELPX|nr:hypothetical protein OUC_1188 [Helicobacter pylori R018c]EKE94458.1 hypothetical protein OUS_1293 [Helicobacter pylori R056a]
MLHLVTYFKKGLFEYQREKLKLITLKKLKEFFKILNSLC